MTLTRLTLTLRWQVPAGWLLGRGGRPVRAEELLQPGGGVPLLRQQGDTHQV